MAMMRAYAIAAAALAAAHLLQAQTVSVYSCGESSCYKNWCSGPMAMPVSATCASVAGWRFGLYVSTVRSGSSVTVTSFNAAGCPSTSRGTVTTFDVGAAGGGGSSCRQVSGYSSTYLFATEGAPASIATTTMSTTVTLLGVDTSALSTGAFSSTQGGLGALLKSTFSSFVYQYGNEGGNGLPQAHRPAADDVTLCSAVTGDGARLFSELGCPASTAGRRLPAAGAAQAGEPADTVEAVDSDKDEGTGSAARGARPTGGLRALQQSSSGGSLVLKFQVTGMPTVVVKRLSSRLQYDMIVGLVGTFETQARPSSMEVATWDAVKAALRYPSMASTVTFTSDSGTATTTAGGSSSGSSSGSGGGGTTTQANPSAPATLYATLTVGGLDSTRSVPDGVALLGTLASSAVGATIQGATGVAPASVRTCYVDQVLLAGGTTGAGLRLYSNTACVASAARRLLASSSDDASDASDTAAAAAAASGRALATFSVSIRVEATTTAFAATVVASLAPALLAQKLAASMRQLAASASSAAGLTGTAASNFAASVEGATLALALDPLPDSVIANAGNVNAAVVAAGGGSASGSGGGLSQAAVIAIAVGASVGALCLATLAVVWLCPCSCKPVGTQRRGKRAVSPLTSH